MGWDAWGSLTAFCLFIPTNADSLSPATEILGKAKSSFIIFPVPKKVDKIS